MIINCITTKHNRERQLKAVEAWKGHDLRFHYSPDWRDFQCDGFKRVWGLNCCLFGHASLWHKLGTEDAKSWHIIVEDDAFPESDFGVIVRICMAENRFNIIRLHHCGTSQEVGITQTNQHNWISTAAYIIRDPLERLKQLGHRPVDWQFCNIFHAGCVYPTACNRLVESTIRYD